MDTSKQSDMAPQKVNVTIYKKNMIKQKTIAYQCTKFTTHVTTQISFFRDIKTKTTSSSTQKVTLEECTDMVIHKKCQAGVLHGGDGMYITNEPTNAMYVWCCQQKTFSAKQCSYVETYLYKKHGSDEFESTAGDVSHCNYNNGHCELNDGSMLMWDLDIVETCEYTPWFNESGEFLDAHFVSKKRDLALTFYNSGLNSQMDCNNSNVSLSDQGLVVKFLTPLTNVTINDTIKERVSVEGRDAALFNTMLQSLAYQQTKIAQDLFWSAYFYACHNLAETLQIITMLLGEHPTLSARYLLDKPNVIATAGPGFLQVYPCTILNYSQYEVLPMEENNCTEFIPMKIKIAGAEKIGYFNPEDNVIHPDTYTVNCKTKRGTLMMLKYNISEYFVNNFANKGGHQLEHSGHQLRQPASTNTRNHIQQSLRVRMVKHRRLRRTD